MLPLGVAPDDIIRLAPLICIEVLSPEDSLGDMQERISEYAAMGVPHIWLIDPVRRRTWTADAVGTYPMAADAFTVPSTPIRIALADLYHELDELAAGR